MIQQATQYIDIAVRMLLATSYCRVIIFMVPVVDNVEENSSMNEGDDPAIGTHWLDSISSNQITSCKIISNSRIIILGVAISHSAEIRGVHDEMLLLSCTMPHGPKLVSSNAFTVVPSHIRGPKNNGCWTLALSAVADA